VSATGPRVLILTASYGSGHNRVASTLAARFRRDGALPRVVDHFYDLVHPEFDRLTRTLYYAVLRPVIGSTHVVQIFTTLGLSIVLQNAALMLWTANFRQLQLPYSDKVIAVGGGVLTLPQLIAFSVAALFTLALFAWLKLTYLGKAMRATAQDPKAATLVGIDTRKMFLVAFLVGTICVAVAGMLMAPLFPTYPTVGLQFALVAFVVVVLGGLGSAVGALIGGLIVAFLDVMGGFYVGTAWKEVLYFIVFISVLLIRPAGLFGQRGAEELGS
jgi:branched-chain amino acid transport system permease protein